MLNVRSLQYLADEFNLTIDFNNGEYSLQFSSHKELLMGLHILKLIKYEHVTVSGLTLYIDLRPEYLARIVYNCPYILFDDVEEELFCNFGGIGISYMECIVTDIKAFKRWFSVFKPYGISLQKSKYNAQKYHIFQRSEQ